MKRVAFPTLLLLPWAVGAANDAGAQARALQEIRTVESELLADPFAVLEGSGGVLFVSDPLSKGLYRISPAGEWVRFAREGQGPGELRVFAGLGLRGDTVCAPDPGSRSVVLFDQEGGFLDVVRPSIPPWGSLHFALVPVLLLPGDGILIVPGVFSDAISSGQLEWAPWLRYSRTGESHDTLILQRLAGTRVRLDTGSQLSPTVPEPFLSAPVVTGDLRGELLVMAEEVRTGLRLSWLLLSSGHRVVQEIPLDRVPLRRSDVNAELRRLAGAAERWNLQPARLESIYRNTVTIPDHQPLFTDAVAASGGYVWLKGFTVSDEVTWTRHSMAGGAPVSITLRRRDQIKDAGDDWLWIVRRDELDVPRLVKLRVGGG